MTTCARCGQWREPDELLRVTDVRTGEARYVCRPSVAPGCFRDGVRSRVRDTIELA